MDIFANVIEVSDGYVAVGSSASEDGDLTGLINKGHYDDIIVKFDFYGNVLWKNNFGGSDEDYFYNIAASSDGYIVVGETYSDDYDFQGLNKGSYDAFIAKYDLNDNLVWLQTFGGSELDDFYGVIATNDWYIAVGSSYSTDGDLEGLDKEEYDRDVIIVKYGFTGNILFKRM